MDDAVTRTAWHPDDPVAHWGSDAFRADAEAWVRAALAAAGRELRGPLRTHRLRFWSAVLTADTDRGPVWFKAANPGQAFEAGVLAVLARHVPDDVLTPLAVDAGRGWVLLPDGGPTWREAGADVDDWERLLLQAARVQRALVPAGAELAAAGLPRLLPQDAPAYVEALVEDLAALPPADPQHVDAATARTLLAGVPALAADLDALVATGVPATFQPNDLSTGNAFAPRAGSGPRLFDVGDAFWSHPFAVLHLTTRMAAGTWPHAPAPDDTVARRLRRAYLTAWSPDLPGVLPDDVAARALDAADRLGAVHRCESWRRLLAHVAPAAVPAPVPRLADWLAEAVRPRPAR